MLLRLFLVMMLAFATPAMPAAACHEAPAVMAHHEMGHSRDHQPVQVEHLCVGCTAVADWNGARIAPPVMLPTAIPVVTIAALSLLPGRAPAPPPPRTA